MPLHVHMLTSCSRQYYVQNTSSDHILSCFYGPRIIIVTDINLLLLRSGDRNYLTLYLVKFPPPNTARPAEIWPYPRRQFP
jgi:hypothetical protein